MRLKRAEDSLANLADILERGHQRDPFGVLGLHAAAGRRTYRTFQPQAARVELLDSDGRPVVTFARVGKTGLFVADLAEGVDGRRLRIEEPGGARYERDDPYRFPSRLGDLDLHLIGEGSHERIYERLGAHIVEIDGVSGVHFAVWAPNAFRCSVVGNFNDWDGRRHVMRLHPGVGIWDIFVPGLGPLTQYKFELLDAGRHMLPLKADPYAFFSEQPPGNASLVYASAYRWQDAAWMERRGESLGFDRPISIYEVHLGSWRRNVEQGDRALTYRELAEELVDYVASMGFTHIELLPVSEHPFGGSWGYQPVGLFAPTSRYGEPDDLRHLIDRCHQAGIGVILDWVAAHFPNDAHGIAGFDGTALYEHADPKRGIHPDWDTLVSNYGRTEVQNYLVANALYWINEFHLDALRVDAVASMLYLDYSREEGQWIPNEHGGNENLEAITFLRRFNELVHAAGAVTIAEESTAWPSVSRPTYLGGLGFSYKWNMGWMNDTLAYMRENPVHRKYHHDRMTFGMVYAYNENFILPLSHDEVVHGKRSLIGRMPGDDWQRFANLRAYFAYMFAHPGKKLLFMGAELAQFDEWHHDRSLDWHLGEYAPHAGVQTLVRELNACYRRTPALHEIDYDDSGFRWLDWNDRDNSVLAWVRFARDGSALVSVTNFTPVVRTDYRLGVPHVGRYREAINTDRLEYGGSGVVNPQIVAADGPYQDLPASIGVTLPPLATVYLELEQ